MAASNPTAPNAHASGSDALVTFELPGPREMVTTAERAEELAKPLQDALEHKQVNKYSKIRLGGKSFNVVAAKVFASKLEKLQGIRVADLSDIIAGQHEDTAQEVLLHLCTSLKEHPLEEINLSDNALGLRGVKACTNAFINQKHLQRVYFNNNGLDELSAQAIVDLVMPVKDTVTTFHIYRNLLRGGGGRALGTLFSHLSQLQDLRVSGTRLTPDGGVALLKGLQSHHTLRSMDLSDNSFGPHSAPLLARIIRQNKQLHTLVIGDTSLEGGIAVVLRALKDSVPDLVSLSLTCSELSPKRAHLLAEVISAHPKLVRLHVDGNRLRDSGLQVLADALKVHKSVRELSVAENRLKAAAVNTLLDMQLHSHLAALNFNRNRLRDEAVARLRSEVSASVLASLSDNEEEMTDTEDEEDDDMSDDDTAVPHPQSSSSSSAAAAAAAVDKDVAELTAGIAKTTL